MTHDSRDRVEWYRGMAGIRLFEEFLPIARSGQSRRSTITLLG